MKPRIIDKKVLQASTIRSIWRILLRILQFKHCDFDTRYTEYDSMRIHEFIEQRISIGQLRRGRFLSRQWLGFSALQEMVQGHLQNCLSSGVRDWDLQLICILAFVLQYTLCSRAGDLTRSRYYTGRQFLAYKDVSITLREDHANSPTVQDLKACVQLRFTKGRK